MDKSKIFNPAAFEENSENVPKNNSEEKEHKAYPTTGITQRDNMRKIFFELLEGEERSLQGELSCSASDLSVKIEDAILEKCTDPKSKAYRDMNRAIQVKLKVNYHVKLSLRVLALPIHVRNF